MIRRIFHFFPLLLLSSAVLVSCGGPGEIKGDRLNDFLPNDADGMTVLVTTEKPGFVQASLKSGSEEIATLAISDLLNDPDGAKKFENAPAAVGGFPVIARGEAGTAALAGRFQVQVRSAGAHFGEAERKKWLEKFDLSGLAALK